jgi:hypothetical protein
MLRIIFAVILTVSTAIAANAAEKKAELNPAFTEENFKNIQATLKNFTPEQIKAIAAEAKKTQPELQNVSSDHIENMLNSMTKMQSAKELSSLGKVASN